MGKWIMGVGLFVICGPVVFLGLGAGMEVTKSEAPGNAAFLLALLGLALILLGLWIRIVEKNGGRW